MASGPVMAAAVGTAAAAVLPLSGSALSIWSRVGLSAGIPAGTAGLSLFAGLLLRRTPGLLYRRAVPSLSLASSAAPAAAVAGAVFPPLLTLLLLNGGRGLSLIHI